MEGPSHRAGKERYNGGTPNDRTGRHEEQKSAGAARRGYQRQENGAGKGRMGVGGRHQAVRAVWSELGSPGPSTSVIVTHAIKINQSMNQSTTTNRPACQPNEPTIQRIIHRSSQPDKASGQPSALPACPRTATFCTAAHVPAGVGRQPGYQSPASICILSTIRTSTRLPLQALVRHTCQLGRSLGLPRSRRCLEVPRPPRTQLSNLLRAGILPCTPCQTASMQALGQMALESF